MGKIFNLLLVVAFVCGGYFFAGPYMAVAGLTKALENEDAAAVSAYVDFEALRTSFTDDFAQRMGLEQKGTDLASILATRIAGAFIQKIVSPESMIAILKDKDHRNRVGLADNYADIFANGSWQGTSAFTLADETGAPVTLLERDGLSWKLVAMRLK